MTFLVLNRLYVLWNWKSTFSFHSLAHISLTMEPLLIANHSHHIQGREQVFLACKSSGLQGGSCMKDFRERLDLVEAYWGHLGQLQSWVPFLQNTLQNQGLWDPQPPMKPIAKASFITVFVTNGFIISPQQCQYALILFPLCIIWCQCIPTQLWFSLARRKLCRAQVHGLWAVIYTRAKQMEIASGSGWYSLPACSTAGNHPPSVRCSATAIPASGL